MPHRTMQKKIGFSKSTRGGILLASGRVGIHPSRALSIIVELQKKTAMREHGGQSRLEKLRGAATALRGNPSMVMRCFASPPPRTPHLRRGDLHASEEKPPSSSASSVAVAFLRALWGDTLPPAGHLLIWTAKDSRSEEAWRDNACESHMPSAVREVVRREALRVAEISLDWLDALEGRGFPKFGRMDRKSIPPNTLMPEGLIQ